MLQQIHEWVSALSTLTGLDDWLLSGGLFTIVLWLSKHLGLVGLRRMAGEHLAIGEKGQGILDKLEESGWSTAVRTLNKKKHEAVFLGKITICPSEPAIEAGGRDVTPYLNRRERRLIYEAARDIQVALVKAQDKVDESAVNEAIYA